MDPVRAVVVPLLVSQNAANQQLLVLVTEQFTLTNVNVQISSHLAAIHAVHQQLAVLQHQSVVLLQNHAVKHLQSLAVQNQHAVLLQKLAMLHQHAVLLLKLAAQNQHVVLLQKLAALDVTVVEVGVEKVC